MQDDKKEKMDCSLLHKATPGFPVTESAQQIGPNFNGRGTVWSALLQKS